MASISLILFDQRECHMSAPCLPSESDECCNDLLCFTHESENRDEEEIPEGVIGAIQERLWILKFPIYEL
jgi:hypothetical protein